MGDGMLSLYWNNHKATFCHILATLREKERYTDATIACDGKFYPVHKLVLSTCSEYFEGMFEHTPCKHPVIVLKDVKCDEMEALLSYMYAGVVSVAQNDLARLIKAAEMLQIKGLAVPDEPPNTEEMRKPAPHRREERYSPQPKRRRREENGTPSQGGSQPSSSPPSSPRASPYQGEVESTRGRVRTQSEGPRIERVAAAATEHADNSQHDPPPPSDVKQIMVDESLVKEEMVDTIDSGPSESMDDGLPYGHVGSEGGMDGSSQDDPSSQMLTNKYEHMIPGQQQPLADAVAEALAGPSGMQGWLGTDMSGGFASENYGSEGGQEVHPGQPGGQPRVPTRVNKPPRPGEVNVMVDMRRGGLSGAGAVVSAASVTISGTSPLKHQCPVCSYQTTDVAHLNYHIRAHVGEKPYACQYCPYKASKKTHLQNHLLIHTGEEPYACLLCPYRSKQKGNLKRHVLTNHTMPKSTTGPQQPHDAQE